MSVSLNSPETYHSIQYAKSAYRLENPHVSFGPLIQEKSTVPPFRFSFTKYQIYLLVDATDPYNVFVQEVMFTRFELDDIYDEKTEEYDGYDVFYHFLRKVLDREQDREQDRERCISGSSLSETETNNCIMVYTRMVEW